MSRRLQWVTGPINVEDVITSFDNSIIEGRCYEATSLTDDFSLTIPRNVANCAIMLQWNDTEATKALDIDFDKDRLIKWVEVDHTAGESSSDSMCKVIIDDSLSYTIPSGVSYSKVNVVLNNDIVEVYIYNLTE